MQVITIPKELAKNDDLVVMPRKEYEAFLSIIKKQPADDWIYEKPFISELRKRIKVGKKALKENKLIPWKKR
ncbi:MAG: hypothetical protein AAB371_01380 [Patescibacteria group bacterium]